MLDKFLAEFGLKDSHFITKLQHNQLMENCLYWVDKRFDQGYYISINIELTLRQLKKEEREIYNEIYWEAESHGTGGGSLS